MGIVINSIEQQEMVPQVTLDRKLWLNADKTKVVEDGDPEAAFLYGIPGHQVPRPEAERLGALPKPEPSKPLVVKKVRVPKSKTTTELVDEEEEG